jgi:hypothetical protein
MLRESTKPPHDGSDVNLEPSLLKRGRDRMMAALRIANSKLANLCAPLVAIAQIGSKSRVHHHRGQEFLAIGKPDEAEAEFRIAMQYRTNRIAAVRGLLQALKDQGRIEQVVPELLKMAERMSEDEIRQLPFPAYCVSQVAHDESLRLDLDRLVTNNPRAFDATVLLALVEAKRENVDGSIRLFRNLAIHHYGKLHHPDAAPAEPRFLILGQPKAATTTLFHSLTHHPRMTGPLLKEPNYWSSEYALGPNWYQSLFPHWTEESWQFTGEASTSYLLHPEAPARVAKSLPKVKLIVSLRNPVSRAYSEYWMQRGFGNLGLSFEEFANKLMKRREFCPFNRVKTNKNGLPNNLFVGSVVLPGLRNWLDFFPPEQLLVVRDEAVKRDLQAVVRQICRFLEVPTFELPASIHMNVGHYPPMPEDLKRRLEAWYTPHEEALKVFLATHPNKIL